MKEVKVNIYSLDEAFLFLLMDSKDEMLAIQTLIKARKLKMQPHEMKAFIRDFVKSHGVHREVSDSERYLYGLNDDIHFLLV